MGVINAENTLTFKSSKQLFARIKKTLSSYDSEDLIDDGDFHKHIVYILEELGAAVFKECQAVVEVKNYKGRMPGNFKIFHAALRCRSKGGRITSINEQTPLLYYQDTEITTEPVDGCKVKCCKDKEKTTIIIRTFINGVDEEYSLNNVGMLRLSPNGQTLCTDEGKRLFSGCADEISVDDEGYVHTNFEEDYIYFQYYGLPLDKDGLPMIPANESVEKAIEYYIYKMLFEGFYLNSSVPNTGQFLQYVKGEFDFYLPQARYWAKLPSFQKMLNSIRNIRSRNKFFNYKFDNTVVR